jgi:hypothetical protein
MLKHQSPGLRLIISMADPAQGHIGGIYQAGNWIYTGQTKPDVQYLLKGKWVHHRTATSSGSAKGLPSRPMPAKYRYLMPLDGETKNRIQAMARPYPKRVESDTNDTASVQDAEGGVTPTSTLQSLCRKSLIPISKQVEKLGQLQCTYEELAAYFEVAKRTVIRWMEQEAFSEALERGKAMGRISLRRAQTQAALGGNPTMLIWLGQTASWSRKMSSIRKFRVN